MLKFYPVHSTITTYSGCKIHSSHGVTLLAKIVQAHTSKIRLPGSDMKYCKKKFKDQFIDTITIFLKQGRFVAPRAEVGTATKGLAKHRSCTSEVGLAIKPAFN